MVEDSIYVSFSGGDYPYDLTRRKVSFVLIVVEQFVLLFALMYIFCITLDIEPSNMRKDVIS